MAEPDFYYTPLSRLGSWLHQLLGPSQTTVTQGPTKTRTLSLPSDLPECPQGTVTCTRIIYHTRYARWWVPNVHRTLYEVTMDVPPEMIRRHGPAPFQPRVYPLLCNHLLQWTTYPHVCAIIAYMDALILYLEDTLHAP